MQLGCNKSSRELLRAPRVAIGAVKLQSVTSGCCTVTAEAAGSSPVVPAIFSEDLRLGRGRIRVVIELQIHALSGSQILNSLRSIPERSLVPHTFLECQKTGTLPQIWHCHRGSVIYRTLLRLLSPNNSASSAGSGALRALVVAMHFASRQRSPWLEYNVERL